MEEAGVRVLNLGCGTKTSGCPDVVNIDCSVYLRIRRNPLLRSAVPLFLCGARLERYRSLLANILVHDLSRGLPFESNSVDVVYHSHMLEHLDRAIVPGFLAEVLRVLKPGGIQRVVVPDLEVLCGRYLEHLAACQSDRREIARHDSLVAAFLEQSVRKESDATSRQGPVRRFLENLLLGDARRRGAMHQWMYDRCNLGAVLEEAGYRDVSVEADNTSEEAR